MGKKQHQKDKLYLTCTEWREVYGGRTPVNPKKPRSHLPFFVCSLTFKPFKEAAAIYGTDGHVFDRESVRSFITNYKRNPINGEKCSLDDIIDLKFHLNESGDFHCPVTFKVFNAHTPIVAIRSSGNVFSEDAVNELNIKTQNYRDLLSDTPFLGKKDIIRIQDPKRSLELDEKIGDFYHVKQELVLNDQIEPLDKSSCLNNVSVEALCVLKQLDETNEQKHDCDIKKRPVSKIMASHISTGQLAASLTSTVIEPVTELIPLQNDKDTVIQSRVLKTKRKAYVSLKTRKGHLVRIELYADIVPKTVHNFMLLCRRNYYDDCLFFRSIKNFILQTGDPTNSGKGGQSAWGKPFGDEIAKQLKHDSRGVLSMANSGPNTNRSQFFILYRPRPELDGNHSVFGRVVGGLGVLKTIEDLDVNKKDKPRIDVKIVETIIYVDPFDNERLRLEEELRMELESCRTTVKRNREILGNRVGRYLNTTLETTDKSQGSEDSDHDETNEYEIKKKARKTRIEGQKLQFESW
ncbi:hypothetical protein ACOME3_001861 [Neoechinorhynchus agilis]